MKTKNSSVLRRLLDVRYHPILIDVVCYVDDEFPNLGICTSGFREGDTGVHGTNPCRGLDLREWVFDDPQAICDKINKIWEYDAKRPKKFVAKIHISKSKWAGAHPAKHIHLQVHPNTRRR